MSTENSYKENEDKALSQDAVSGSASNGFRPNVYISDDLEDLKRKYTPIQLQKMWEETYPKSSDIGGKVIIIGKPK